MCPGQWTVLGSFNMILWASKKNNDNLIRSIMNRLRSFVDDNELKDMYMHGHSFTRSNEWAIPQ